MTTRSHAKVGLRGRIGKAAVSAFGAAVLLILGLAGPAAAHDTVRYLTYNGITVGRGGVTASHHYAYACDMRADGNSIYTEYRYSGGSGRVYDSTSTSACTQRYVGPTITSYRVCMDISYWPDPCTSPWSAA